MKKKEVVKLLLVGFLTILFTIGCSLPGFNNSEDNNSPNNNPPNNGDSDQEVTIEWGIDTASLVTEDFYDCVVNEFGEPEFIGRYMLQIEGVSFKMTQEEIQLIHENNARILPIYNGVSEATGYEHAINHAEEAINIAQELGIPEGTPIIVDIEPSFPVDQEFIRGWVESISNSSYEPGIYGVFQPDTAVSNAYVSYKEQYGVTDEDVVIWSANPTGITTKANAPEFNPGAPQGIDVEIWQYGLDAQACNIDTNLILSSTLDDLW
ncbi:DUF1906 domain-containing protein [Bacillaceae bacterium S4-13-56]